MRVLVIEDNEDMRFLVHRGLSRAVPHSDITLASDAADVLRPNNQFRPDVVILDSLTIGPSSSETAATLRNRDPNVLIVSFSGRPAKEMSWADIIVEKGPDSIKVLAEVVAGVADDSRADQHRP